MLYRDWGQAESQVPRYAIGFCQPSRSVRGRLLPSSVQLVRCIAAGGHNLLDLPAEGHDQGAARATLVLRSRCEKSLIKYQATNRGPIWAPQTVKLPHRGTFY